MLDRQAAKGEKVSVQQTPLVAAGHHREPVQNVESPLALWKTEMYALILVVNFGRASRRQFGPSTDDLHTHAYNGRANVGLCCEMLRLSGWPSVRCQRAGRTHMSRKSGTTTAATLAQVASVVVRLLSVTKCNEKSVSKVLDGRLRPVRHRRHPTARDPHRQTVSGVRAR
jgi:hypothetical protein